MRLLTSRAFLFSLFGLLLVSATNGQPKWHVYTSTSKSFSVELPWKPINRMRHLSPLSTARGDLKGSTTDDWYDLSMYVNESSTSFFIHVYQVGFKRSQDQFDSEVHQFLLETYLRCRILSDEPAVVNGLPGRELIYQHDKVSGRILFINGGYRIYMVQFSTEDKKGISRGPVDRVFSTFQPAPQ